MKTVKTLLTILILVMMSVSSYSQDWQPRKVTLNDKQGVFISFALMDTISVKLIERKSLKFQNESLLSLYDNEKAKTKQLEQKNKLMYENALKQESINYASKRQTDLVKDDLNMQKELTKKARRNGLKFLITGIVLGAIGGSVIIN
jgi:hypothetical protein